MKRALISSGIILMALFMWACENSGNEILELTASDSLVVAGGSVSLVCTATDDDGDNLSYIWKCASGTLTPNDNRATWVAPMKSGIYFISCTIFDGAGASDAATIVIEVIKGNTEPVIISLTANETTVSPGGTVLLTCTAEDDVGDTLTYSWESTDGSFAPNGSTATWTAPDSPGSYSISCTVVDGAGASDNADIAIEVINTEPVIISFTADNTTTSPGGTVSLTCTVEDDDEDILTYSWECTDGNFDPNGSTATWTAPDSPGTYSISCTVVDGAGGSDAATIAIEVIPVSGVGVSGKVLNAVDQSPVANVSVTISGQTGTTDTDGNYTILNVGPGDHDVAGASDGFCPFSAPFTIPDSYEDESFTYNFSMSPMLDGEQIRIVLNWGATPRDLDSHLLTPEIEGNTHHIYYSNSGSYNVAPYAKLDTDDTNGYGPETITINQLFAGTYTYYIKNFSGGSSGLKNSDAVVQIYSGESCAANIIEVPTDTNGLFWHVCNIDGATGDITVVNEIQSSAP
jgi:hypothetical protein